MNKKEEALLVGIETAIRTLAGTVVLKEIKQPPVVFEDKCSKCDRVTSHVSHIAGEAKPQDIQYLMAGTTCFSPRRQALKTCLSCGKLTYIEGEM